MKRGAVLLMDALGTKGIWDGPPERAELVLNDLMSLQDYLFTHMREIEKKTKLAIGIAPVTWEALFLSDTLFIGCNWRLPLDVESGDAMAIFFVAQLASGVMAKAAQFDPAFPFRGCISFGNYESKGNFILGPAVDQACERMNDAEGAFVWLDPKIRDLASRSASVGVPAFDPRAPGIDRRRWSFEAAFSTLFVEYDIPLKKGTERSALVINPLRLAPDETARAIRDGILRRMDSPDERVQLKARNTAAFLEACWSSRGQLT